MDAAHEGVRAEAEDADVEHAGGPEQALLCGVAGDVGHHLVAEQHLELRSPLDQLQAGQPLRRLHDEDVAVVRDAHRLLADPLHAGVVHQVVHALDDRATSAGSRRSTARRCTALVGAVLWTESGGAPRGGARGTAAPRASTASGARPHRPVLPDGEGVEHRVAVRAARPRLLWLGELLRAGPRRVAVRGPRPVKPHSGVFARLRCAAPCAHRTRSAIWPPVPCVLRA